MFSRCPQCGYNEKDLHNPNKPLDETYMISNKAPNEKIPLAVCELNDKPTKKGWDGCNIVLSMADTPGNEFKYPILMEDLHSYFDPERPDLGVEHIVRSLWKVVQPNKQAIYAELCTVSKSYNYRDNAWQISIEDASVLDLENEKHKKIIANCFPAESI